MSVAFRAVLELLKQASILPFVRVIFQKITRSYYARLYYQREPGCRSKNYNASVVGYTMSADRRLPNLGTWVANSITAENKVYIPAVRMLS